jgi:plastocyanin
MCALKSAALIIPAGIAAAIAISLIFVAPAVAFVAIVNEGTEPDDAVFRPGTVTVRSGTTVMWTNADGSAHTVTSGAPGDPDGVFHSQVMGPGEEYSFTFANRGAYGYFCQLHPIMTGAVIVE